MHDSQPEVENYRLRLEELPRSASARPCSQPTDFTPRWHRKLTMISKSKMVASKDGEGHLALTRERAPLTVTVESLHLSLSLSLSQLKNVTDEKNILMVRHTQDSFHHCPGEGIGDLVGQDAALRALRLQNSRARECFADKTKHLVTTLF